MYLARNIQSQRLRTTWDKYVQINETEVDGTHIVEAHYNEFREPRETKFLCVVRTEAFDIEKAITIKGKYSINLT